MPEIKRLPILTLAGDGSEYVTFDADHTLADISRWIVDIGGAEDMIWLLQQELDSRRKAG